MFKRIKQLLCKLNIHKWLYVYPDFKFTKYNRFKMTGRYCSRCKIQQRLYMDGTWIDSAYSYKK
jgi:hypothetical protein